MSKKKTHKKEREWFKLDNAANIYPAIISAKWSPNFRVSATLNEQVDPDKLLKALKICLPRFRNFTLVLKKGFFWHYLEENDKEPVLCEEVRNPMRVITKHDNNGYHFRVISYKNRIAVEIMHVIADGTGGMMFLKTLVAEYLRQTGVKVPYDAEGILDVRQKPDPEEMEDSFRKYTRFHAKQARKESRAYWVKGTRQKPGSATIITGRMPVAEVSAKAKEYGATITEFIASVIIYVMYMRQKSENHRRELPVKVSVPINLRSFYPSKTLRNFSLFINPGIEPRYGDYTFDEIVSDVHHFMKMNLKEKYLNAVMSSNLGDELNPMVRIIPLPLKNMVLSMMYSSVGETRFSTDMSNLGAIKLPKEMEEHINTVDFMLAAPHGIGFAMGIAGYNGSLNITFATALRELDCQREFFRELVKMGIHVKIESNHR